MATIFKQRKPALGSLVAIKGFRVKSHFMLISFALPILAFGWFDLLGLTMHRSYESDRIRSTSTLGSPRNEDCLEKAEWCRIPDTVRAEAPRAFHMSAQCSTNSESRGSMPGTGY